MNTVSNTFQHSQKTFSEGVVVMIESLTTNLQTPARPAVGCEAAPTHPLFARQADHTPEGMQYLGSSGTFALTRPTTKKFETVMLRNANPQALQ